MLNIKNTISFAALLGGLLIIFVAPQQASAQIGNIIGQAAQFIPPGSYQKSCKNIKTDGATLKAFCNGGSGKLGFPDMNADSELPDYFECEGDIRNDDATLKCNRNPNSALIQKAKAAINAGHKNVVGTDLTENAKKTFLQLLFEDGMAQKFYDGNLGGLANLGLIPWFQTWLSKPENSGKKSTVIQRAFLDVYNYGPIPKDVAFYTNSPTGFQTIILAEQKKLNADKVIRRLMISEAYKSSMGRNPTTAEFDYWLPKQEYFAQLVEANRAFLYGGSVKGSGDLVETVKRALNKNGNNPKPDIEQINKAITKYSKDKYIYDQMN